MTNKPYGREIHTKLLQRIQGRSTIGRGISHSNFATTSHPLHVLEEKVEQTDRQKHRIYASSASGDGYHRKMEVPSSHW